MLCRKLNKIQHAGDHFYKYHPFEPGNVFRRSYGYTFEHEATYERMCLVNNAVYIAKYMAADQCEALYGYIPGDCEDEGGEWTATGTQFQVPYVFKTLFSKEKIEFTDLCETKTVSKGATLIKRLHRHVAFLNPPFMMHLESDNRKERL